MAKVNTRVVALLILICVHWTTAQYDFIVNGLGTAGSIIAERLSRNPQNRVLVLEKGSDLSAIYSQIVALWNAASVGAGNNTKLISSENFFFQHFMSQETTLSGRSLRAEVPLTCGSDVVNGNAAGRFSTEDLAAWNNPLWTYNSTLNAWKAIEGCQGPICDPAYHGLDGPIKTNTFTMNTMQQQLTNLMPSIFGVPLITDSNGPSATGVSQMHRNIEVVNGQPIRQDSYSKIVKPVLGRPNLHILFGADVQKIEFDLSPSQNKQHRACFTHDSNYRCEKAHREMINCLGTIIGPTLYLRSGFGPCDELDPINVTCVINNPHVGKNVQDSVLTSVVYTALAIPAQPAPPGAITVAYYKSPTFTGNGTDMEVALANVSPLGNTFLVQQTQLRHSALGEIKLFNNNPNYPPLVSYNFWPTDADGMPMVDQLLKIRAHWAAFTATTGIPAIELRPGFGTVPLGASNTTILTYYKSVIGVEGHVVGSNSMNKVVDGRGRAIDGNGNVIPGIRSADNSIIPLSPRTHSTSSGAKLIASHIADMICEDLPGVC